MRRVVSCFALALCVSVPALAQTSATTVAARATAVVLADAPIYVSVPPGPTPLRTAAVGTTLNVFGEQNEWLLVEFNDPQLGPRRGYVQKKLVRVENPALKPMDLSVSPQPVVSPTSTGNSAQAVSANQGDGNRGFVLLLNMGVGIQYDPYFAETAVGLGGLNLGIGGFVNKKLAVMARFSGTNVTYASGTFAETGQVSGVLGVTVQQWLTDRISIEVGGGYGYWQTPFDSDSGFGTIVGFSGILANHGRHNLVAGAEYAVVYTDTPAAVHNVGFTIGYQLGPRVRK
jgi:hypothetical protein